MPNLVLNLSDQEFDDLSSVATARGLTTEATAHNLLVATIAAEVAQSPNARTRTYDDGIQTARRQAVFSDGLVRALKTLNQPAHPQWR